MPYVDQITNVQQPRTLDKQAITEAFVYQMPDAQAFVTEYGKSNREFIRSLVGPYRADPWGEGRPLGLVAGSSLRSVPSSYRPRKNNGKLFAKYEHILGSLGMSANCQTGATQAVIVPADASQPLQRHYSTPIECERKYGINPEGGMRTIPISIHKREIPEWTADDKKLAAYLVHRCPGAFPHPSGKSRTPAVERRAHRKVAELCAVLYLWFRMLLPARVIADDLGITVERVLMIAGDAREHYPRFEAGTCQCHRRSSKNRQGLEYEPRSAIAA